VTFDLDICLTVWVKLKGQDHRSEFKVTWGNC